MQRGWVHLTARLDAQLLLERLQGLRELGCPLTVDGTRPVAGQLQGGLHRRGVDDCLDAASPFTARTAADSAAAVAWSTTPVTGSSASVWSASTAATVEGPYTPSIATVVEAGGLQRGLERRRVVGHGCHRGGRLLLGQAVSVGEQAQPRDLERIGGGVQARRCIADRGVVADALRGRREVLLGEPHPIDRRGVDRRDRRGGGGCRRRRRLRRREGRLGVGQLLVRLGEVVVRLGDVLGARLDGLAGRPGRRPPS